MEQVNRKVFVGPMRGNMRVGVPVVQVLVRAARKKDKCFACGEVVPKNKRTSKPFRGRPRSRSPEQDRGRRRSPNRAHSGRSASRVDDKARSKKEVDKPCWAWKRSGFKRCRFGDDCKFRHDTKPDQDGDSQHLSRNADRPCRQWTKSGFKRCSFGSDCKFLHGQHPQASATSKTRRCSPLPVNRSADEVSFKVYLGSAFCERA
jgi:hypothetical protein